MSRLSYGRVVALFFIVIYCFIILVPMFWLLLASFKDNVDIFSNPMGFPRKILLQNYIDAWDGGVKDYFFNSVEIVIATTSLTVFVSTMASYALAKLDFKINNIIYIVIILVYAVPSQGVLVPLYSLMSNLHLINKTLGLVLPYTAFGIPFSVIILYTFFLDFPLELEDAAKLDGASHFQTMLKIVLPLSMPAILTVSVIQVISTWNEFFLASLLLNENNQYTLPLGLSTFRGEHLSEWGPIMAAIFISAIPILLLYLFAQKYIVNGLGGMGK